LINIVGGAGLGGVAGIWYGAATARELWGSDRCLGCEGSGPKRSVRHRFGMRRDAALGKRREARARVELRKSGK